MAVYIAVNHMRGSDMEKVKIFYRVNNEEKLENAINEWIEKENPEIISILLRTSGRMDCHMVALIHYKENKNEL